MARSHPDKDRLFCPRCGNEVTEEASGAFAGFPRHACGTCSEQLYAPLPPGPRKAWWAAAMVGLAVADILLLTRIVVPGLLCLVVAGAGIAGLAVNLHLQRSHRARGRNIWLVHLARRTAHISESVVGENGQ